MTVGRFTVTTTTAAKDDNAGDGNTSPGLQIRIVNDQYEDVLSLVGSPQRKRRSLKRKPSRTKPEGRRLITSVGLGDKEFTDQLESRCHGIASKLEGLSGSTTIGKRSSKPCDLQHVKFSDVQASVFHSAAMEDYKSGTEFSEEGFTDSGSEKEDNIPDFYPRRNGLGLYCIVLYCVVLCCVVLCCVVLRCVVLCCVVLCCVVLCCVVLCCVVMGCIV